MKDFNLFRLHNFQINSHKVIYALKLFEYEMEMHSGWTKHGNVAHL